MKRTLLKSKIHRATVTDANLLYQGSCTIDPILMEAADFVPFERIEIYNCTNGERFATYAISGNPGMGEIVLNGAAAHKAGPATSSSSPATPTTRTRSAGPTSRRWSSWTPGTASWPRATSGSRRRSWRR